MMASVSGRRMVKVVPLPSTDAPLRSCRAGLDVAADDIHADAAPGQVGHLFGGREAGLPDQVDDFLVAQRLVRLHQSLVDRLARIFLAAAGRAADIGLHLDDDAAEGHE